MRTTTITITIITTKESTNDCNTIPSPGDFPKDSIFLRPSPRNPSQHTGSKSARQSQAEIENSPELLLMGEFRLTTWDVQNPVNNGHKLPINLVQDFFHQQYQSNSMAAIYSSQESSVSKGWRSCDTYCVYYRHHFSLVLQSLPQMFPDHQSCPATPLCFSPATFIEWFGRFPRL